MADLNTRIITAHDIEENWNAKPEIVPLRGEQIIYDPDETYPYARYKVGDGTTPLKDLPFGVDRAIEAFLSVQDGIVILDGGEITTYPQQSLTK